MQADIPAATPLRFLVVICAKRNAAHHKHLQYHYTAFRCWGVTIPSSGDMSDFLNMLASFLVPRAGVSDIIEAVTIYS